LIKSGNGFMSVGIDFGTTNSVLALAKDRDKVAVARHGEPRESTNFRSILCFVKERGTVRIKAGPAAVAAYLEHGGDCRLIQSVKSMTANPNFTQTAIFGRRYTIEALIAELLKALRESAEADLATLGNEVTAGRPVRFAGQFVDENLALRRLGEAFGLAGFDRIEFVAEPLAAAYQFARRIQQPKLCVIADFGGGTSDFSLVRFVPGKAGLKMETLGASGIGLAGDRLDYRIIEHVICPKLGLNTQYVSMGKRLPIPMHYYARFQRWSDLSFLRAPDILRELRTLKRMAEEPEALDRLLYIIEEELGFELYRAVSSVKAALSVAESARLVFRHGPVQIDEAISRANFEDWIVSDLVKIRVEIDGLVEGSGAVPDDVDNVFMTGGTSFVPAIRRLMTDYFPRAEISDGDEFISVGAGLALYGNERAKVGFKAARSANEDETRAS
jgi:hypothetical chaperone protein